MSNKYGPWATLIDVGGNPQLSAFWRRRLVMLVPASKTSPVLSRRNLSLLAVAGILACILPTVFFTPAAAEDKKPAGSGNVIVDDKSDQETKSANSPTSSGQATQYGVVGTFSGDDAFSSYIRIPCVVYNQLSNEPVRRELRISPDQEKKLRELSDGNLKLEVDSKKQLRAEIEKLAPQVQLAKQRELNDRLAAERNTIRKQIEELLTPEQLTGARSMSIGMSAAGRLLEDQRFGERIGISEEQKKELRQRLLEDAKQDAKLKEKNKQQEQSMKENETKTLALLTPQQWEKLERLAGEKETGLDSIALNGIKANTYPGPEVQELSYPGLDKELSLSEEQQKKLEEIGANSQAQAQELGKIVDKINSFLPEPDKGRASKQDNDFGRKMAEMRKRDHEQIKAALSPQQWAAFKKSAIRHELLLSINLSGLFGGGEGQPGILDIIGATKEQKDEFRKLAEENGSMMRQHYRETGEIILKILNPQQQEKMFAELDRVINPGPEPPAEAAKSPNENQSFTKVGVGTLIIEDAGNSSVDAQPKQPNPDARAGDSAPEPTGPDTMIWNEMPSDFIPLPDYPSLGNPKIRKQLAMSPEQEKKLREISKAFVAEQAKIGEALTSATPEQREARSEEFNRRFQELRTKFNGQITAVLTPLQLDEYKQLMFASTAFGYSMDPKVQKLLEATPTQKEQLQQLLAELSRDAERVIKAKNERTMNLLSPEQMKKLREVERRYAERHEPVIPESAEEKSNMYTGGTLTLGSATFTAVWSPPGVNEAREGTIELPVYENLDSADFRKTLGSARTRTSN